MRAPLATFACEPCRRRKIRCDAKSSVQSTQCSNCRAINLVCHFDLQRKRRGRKPRNFANQGQATLSPPSVDSADTAPKPSPKPSTSPKSSPPSSHGEHGAHRVQRTLIAAVTTVGFSTEEVAERCVDQCAQCIYPGAPMVHIETLRRDVALLASSATSLFDSHIEVGEVVHPPMGMLRRFAHLTAVCAMLSRRQSDIELTIPSDEVSQAFLVASRDMLALIEDWDLQNAISTSLSMRLFHASYLQHRGQNCLSWHLIGSAVRLAMDMQLSNPSSYKDLDPLESKLRRNAFLALVVVEQSNWFLRNRPVSFQDISFGKPLAALSEINNECSLLDAQNPFYRDQFESRLHKGFFLTSSIWDAGASLSTDMKILSRLQKELCTSPPVIDNTLSRSIVAAFVTFEQTLANLPPWLKNPESLVAGTEAVTTFQRKSFWAQRVNLTISYQCIKLMLVHQAADLGFGTLVGVANNSSNALAERKLDITTDLLDALASFPFDSIRVNGEPGVERLRQFGVHLLQISREGDDDAVFRAQPLFSTLIELIARLDSQVSDELYKKLPCDQVQNFLSS